VFLSSESKYLPQDSGFTAANFWLIHNQSQPPWKKHASSYAGILAIISNCNQHSALEYLHGEAHIIFFLRLIDVKPLTARIKNH